MGEIDKPAFSSEIKYNPETENANPLQSELEAYRNAWNRDKRAEDPNIKFNFYFSRHGSPEDFSELENHVKKSNIIVLEIAGWHENDPEILKRLSQGKLGLRDAVRAWGYDDINSKDYKVWYEKLRPLQGSRKPVVIVDAPSNSSIIKRSLAFQARTPHAIKFENFEADLEAIRQNSIAFAKIELERETYILTQLPIKLREVLDANPALKTKDNLNTLIVYGSGHASLHSSLKAKGETSSAVYNFTPYYFDPFNLIVLRNKLGKEVTREMLARRMLEHVLQRVGIGVVSSDHQKVARYYRIILDQLDLEDARTIFNLIAESMKGKQGDLKQQISDHLKIKGITIPKDESELNNFLRAY